MANYYGFTRTNYFHVTDEDKFRTIMNSVYGDGLEIWTQKDNNDVTMFAFGADSALDYKVPNTEEYDVEQLYEALQEIIVDDEAIIITEVGHEKLRYLVADAIVITTNDVRVCDLNEISVAVAGEMLQNVNYKPQMDY